jgi:L-fuconolactonase
MTDADIEAGLRVPESLEHLLTLANLPNVAVKWSWSPLLSRQRFPFLDLLPYLRRYLDAFGADRIMWASDTTQTMWHSTWAESLYYILIADGISEAEKISILGQTAREILRWPSATSQHKNSA